MEEDSFIWTCSERKVKNIIRKRQFDVLLGRKLNSSWTLQLHKVDIKSTSLRVQFCLTRSYGTSGPITVNIFFIQGSEHWFETKEFCGIHTESIELHPITIEKRNVDIYFFFEQNTKLPKQKLSREISFEDTNNLRDDLLSLLNGKRLTDITLKYGSETIAAHKTILSARSPVFEAMFSTDMQESKTNTVAIDDMDTSVFRPWIDFIYGDEVYVTSVVLAYGLLHAAEKYQMKGLKEICIKFFETELSTDNALLLLEVANLYDKEFKENVISYICHHFNDLKTSKEWQDLEKFKPELAFEVYSHKEQL